MYTQHYIAQLAEEPIKTITEFCCEVDAAKGNLDILAELSEYMVIHAYKYSLVNLKFMVEHIGTARTNRRR